MPADHFQPGNIEHLAHRRPDPRALILAANRTTIAALIAGVMSDESFLALIGEPATGKTTLASALREELTSRSARVLQIARGETGEISARQIVAEVLGKSLTELSAADVECFIEVMTRREQPAQRFVLIIDDAELLRSDAIGCLRLLANLTKGVPAQVIFIGRPQFWRVLGHTESPERNGLIKRQWELAEPPPWVNRSAEPSQRVTGPLPDQASPDGEASADRQAKRDKLEAASQPVAGPRRQRRSFGLAAAAVMIFVIGSPALREAPLHSASEQPKETGSRVSLLRKDQPSFEQASAPMSSSAQPGAAEPEQLMPPEATRADQASTDARQEAAQGATGTAPPIADSVAADGGTISPGIVASTVSPPAAAPAIQPAPSAAPPDGSNTTMATIPVPPADAAPTGTSPESAGPASAAFADVGLPAEPSPSYATDGSVRPEIAQPPAAVSASRVTENTAPQPPPEVAATSAVLAQVPERPTAVARPAADVLTEDTVPPLPVEAAATSAVLAQAPEPPTAVARPAADVLTEDTVPPLPVEAAAASAVLAQAPEPPAAAEPPPPATPTEDIISKTHGGAASGSEEVAQVPQSKSKPEESQSAPTSLLPSPAGAAPANTTHLQSLAEAVAPLDLTLLLSRGDAMLELGDISAARRLYERAAALGSARAATAAGKTYDAAFLASIHARGIVPDPAAAAEWYRKAVALGDREAAERLAKLTPLN